MQVVHDLYGVGGAAVDFIEAAFPGVTSSDGAISRPELSKRVVGNADAMHQLESIVHPMVAREKRRFVQAAAQRGAPLVVLDVPLLFETGTDIECDAIAVVSAPAEAQRKRVLKRPGMTPEKLDGILRRQMPDEEKRRLADFVIDTGVSEAETRGHVMAVLDALKGRKGTAWEKMLLK